MPARCEEDFLTTRRHSRVLKLQKRQLKKLGLQNLHRVKNRHVDRTRDSSFMICLPKPGFPQPALNVENEIVVRLLQEHLSSPVITESKLMTEMMCKCRDPLIRSSKSFPVGFHQHRFRFCHCLSRSDFKGLAGMTVVIARPEGFWTSMI